MIPKKTKKANLENKRFIFFQIGLLISLAVAFLAFEWTSGVPKTLLAGSSSGDKFEEETMINTFMKQELPPEIKPDIPIIIKIKKDDDNLTDEALNINPEINPWDVIKIENLSNNDEKEVKDITFRNPEVMPSFMNGDISSFVRYIQSTVVYQEEAINMQLQGKVFADFVVNREGYVENVKIVRGVDPLLDNEVVKALNASPRWRPGKQGNFPVKVAFTIPIVFKLK